jgi:hypothetical protein
MSVIHTNNITNKDGTSGPMISGITTVSSTGFMQVPVGDTRTRLVRDYENIVTNGLVLHLDAGRAASYGGDGTIWRDLSGQNNNGTLQGGVGFTVDDGGSLIFDGVNDSVVTSTRTPNTEFQYTSEFTISSWCRITENSGEGYIVNNRITDANGTSYSGWGLLHVNGSIWGFVGGYPGVLSWRKVIISTTTFDNLVYNKWAHITYLNTGNAGEQKIYINGIDSTLSAFDDTSPPYTINYSNGNSRIYIGLDATFPHYITGNIAQVSIYNRALSAAEVQQNYNALVGRYS